MLGFSLTPAICGALANPSDAEKRANVVSSIS